MGLEPDFLGLLGDEDRDALEAIATVGRVPAGRALVTEGQVADRVIVLRSGRTKIVATTPERGAIIPILSGLSCAMAGENTEGAAAASAPAPASLEKSRRVSLIGNSSLSDAHLSCALAIP